MKYFFILGNHPALSLAELAAVLGRERLMDFNEEAAVFELDNLNALKLIYYLGGTIKIGEIFKEFGLPEFNSFENLLGAVEEMLPQKSEGKFKFGISVYGNQKLNEKKLGMEIKRILKERGLSARWVISREKQLSSVVVDTNKLVSEKGIEVVVTKIGEKIFMGKTLAVQPFRDLSFRDYGRPARDDLSGLLPPKLAQIMINLAGAKKDSVILDPFCGSGTILTEAMLMEFKEVIGSDISQKAIDDTRKNVEWVKNNFELQNISCELYNNGANELSKFITPNSIDAIVTEPYLGPQRGAMDARKTKGELEKLYGEALKEFRKVLKPGAKAIMIWPAFRGRDSLVRITPDINGFNIIKPDFSMKGITERGTLVYGREGQKVWREIVVLELK